MTRNELQSQVRTLLNEPVEGFYLDSEIVSAINTANDLINSILLRLRPEQVFLAYAAASTVTGQKSYCLPVDTIHVNRVALLNTLTNPDDIKRILLPYPQFNSGLTTYSPTGKDAGEPTHFLGRGSKKQIDLFPTPDGIYFLQIAYDFRGTKLNTGVDIPALSEEHHFALALYAAYLVSLKNPVETRNDLHDLFMARKEDIIASYSNWNDNMDNISPFGLYQATGGYR